jgi:DNA-binding NarL/FixJ family response regulator
VALRGEAAAVADPQELPELAAQLAGALESPHAVTPAPPHSLTPRELTILRLITHGQPTKAIARELAVSVATVERHITHLYAKIGVRSRAEATAIAIRSRA